MGDQFVGEIRMFAGNFPPRGWAFCDGQLLSIPQHTALFALLGTAYGGNGQTNFALPDLRGRTPVSFGSGGALGDLAIGTSSGVERVTITPAQMPGHTHAWLVNDGSEGPDTQGDEKHGMPGSGSRLRYVNGKVAPNVALHASTIAASTSPPAAPHENMMPFLSVTFIIALEGIFPPRS